MMIIFALIKFPFDGFSPLNTFITAYVHRSAVLLLPIDLRLLLLIFFLIFFLSQKQFFQLLLLTQKLITSFSM
jgi:hypothetical protein